MKRIGCTIVLAGAISGAAWGFAGSPKGQNAGNGWMDTLSLPSLSSSQNQPFRLFMTTPADGVNHTNESRSFFRTETDSREYNYGNGVLPSGNNVICSFQGSLDGMQDTGGLDCAITGPAGGPLLLSEQRWKIEAGFHGPRVTMMENVSNPTQSQRVVQLFHLFASRIDNVINNEVSTARDPGRVFISGPNSVMDCEAFNKRGAASFVGMYVSTDGSARAALFDGAADDFVGETFVGGPVGTVEVIYQWEITLGAGESAEVGYRFGFVPTPGGAIAYIFGLVCASLRRRRCAATPH